MDSQNSSALPPLCARGCGFYGTAENRNMCSKCYKDHLKQEIISAKPKLSRTSASDPIKILTGNTSVDDDDNNNNNSQEESETSALNSSPVVKKKNRCESCNKKVGFTGFECRCKKLFCGTHRYPQQHSCTFDCKKADRDVLVKQNPLVKADKIDTRI